MISVLRTALRVLLGLFMIAAGIAHWLNPDEFWAQVPLWLPREPWFVDLVVLVSGIVEIGVGVALIAWRKYRPQIGWALALFFVLIFPGNVSQYMNGIDAFGLNSDEARLTRLFFQPVLIAWALWSTEAWAWWRGRE
jgi:uncharacterized membrane protein